MIIMRTEQNTTPSHMVESSVNQLETTNQQYRMEARQQPDATTSPFNASTEADVTSAVTVMNTNVHRLGSANEAASNPEPYMISTESFGPLILNEVSNQMHQGLVGQFVAGRLSI